jgi:hypothetical protein
VTSIILSAREVVGLRNGTISVLRRPASFPLKSRSDGGKKRVFRSTTEEITELNGYLGERQRHPLHSVSGPFWLIGAVLTVQETWGDADHYYQGHTNDVPSVVAYKADLSAIQFNTSKPRVIPDLDKANWNWEHMKWRSPATMPQWASRISIEVTGLRVERLHDSTEDDAKLEGILLPVSSFSDDSERPIQPGKGWPLFRIPPFFDFDPDINRPRRHERLCEWDDQFGKKHPASSNPLTWRAEVKVVEVSRG